VQGTMQPLGDAGQYEQTVRALRWPAGSACPSWASPQGSQRGGDDTAPARQRAACHGCDQRCADRTATIFAGPPQPLPVGGVCLDCLGRHVSHEPMAHAGSLHEREAPPMTAQRRPGRVKKRPQGRWPMRWRVTQPRGWLALRARQRGGRPRAAPGVAADAKGTVDAVRWSRQAPRS
jgi:hypothetical protein